MKLLPYSRIRLVSPLSLESITALFGREIEKKQWLKFGGGGNRFEGSISSNQFTISRIIGYRNGFLPVICGSVEPVNGGSVISLTMRPHIAALVFMGLWFSGVLFGIGAVTLAVITGHSPAHPAMLIPFGMLVFGVALVSGGFWFEATKQKPMLLELFQAKEIVTNAVG